MPLYGPGNPVPGPFSFSDFPALILHALWVCTVRRSVRRVSGCAALCGWWCLAAPPGPRFEVASIRIMRDVPAGGGAAGERGPASSGGCPTLMRVDPGRVEFRCTTFPMLIGYAYRI